MRVTRQDVDVFESATNNGERQFFHIPYGCGLADAKVSLTSASYVSQYVVAKTPELLIRERRAIPAEDPRSQGASVILLSRNVAREGAATNVEPSTDLIRGLQSGMSADQRYLQSVSIFELLVTPDELPHAVRDRVAGASAPLVLDDETRKLLVPLLRQLPSSYYVAGDVRHWQSQMSAGYSSEYKEFVVNPITAKRGERAYYFVPKARECGLSKAPCRTYEYSYRLRNVVSDRPQLIYDPTYRILYVPVHMGVTYRSKVGGGDRTSDAELPPI
jgi:hypothetical protein